MPQMFAGNFYSMSKLLSESNLAYNEKMAHVKL